MRIIIWSMAVMFAVHALVFSDIESLIIGLVIALVGIVMERKIT